MAHTRALVSVVCIYPPASRDFTLGDYHHLTWRMTSFRLRWLHHDAIPLPAACQMLQA